MLIMFVFSFFILCRFSRSAPISTPSTPDANEMIARFVWPVPSSIVAISEAVTAVIGGISMGMAIPTPLTSLENDFDTNITINNAISNASISFVDSSRIRYSDISVGINAPPRLMLIVVNWFWLRFLKGSSKNDGFWVFCCFSSVIGMLTRLPIRMAMYSSSVVSGENPKTIPTDRTM